MFNESLQLLEKCSHLKTSQDTSKLTIIVSEKRVSIAQGHEHETAKRWSQNCIYYPK